MIQETHQEKSKGNIEKEDLIAFYRLENSVLLKIPLEYFLKLAPLRIH